MDTQKRWTKWTKKEHEKKKAEKRSKRGREEDRGKYQDLFVAFNAGQRGKGKERIRIRGLRRNQMADGRWQRQPEETRNDSEKYFILSSTKLVVCDCGCGCHWQPECADFFFLWIFLAFASATDVA